MTDAEKKDKVYNIIQNFISEQNITCAETVCQSDRVIENAYDFIIELCDVVGYANYEDE